MYVNRFRPTKSWHDPEKLQSSLLTTLLWNSTNATQLEAAALRGYALQQFNMAAEKVDENVSQNLKTAGNLFCSYQRTKNGV